MRRLVPVTTVRLYMSGQRAARPVRANHGHLLGCGILVVAVGPVAVIWRTTSLSFAHAKCGALDGSEKKVPGGCALSCFSSHCSPYPCSRVPESTTTVRTSSGANEEGALGRSVSSPA